MAALVLVATSIKYYSLLTIRYSLQKLILVNKTNKY